MYEIETRLDFIRGAMIGLEFPDCREISEDIKFSMVIDLVILRFQLVIWTGEG